MKRQRILIGTLALVLLLALAVGLSQAQGPEPQGDVSTQQIPLGTAFTYQGRLLDGDNPANGNYDFIFALYNAEVGGVQIGTDDPQGNIPVTDGFFTVLLNQADEFGINAFNGEARYLEISVRPHGSSDPYVMLSPRRPLTPAPYAIYAERVSSLTAPDGNPTNALIVDNDGNIHIGGNVSWMGSTRTYQVFYLHAAQNSQDELNLGQWDLCSILSYEVTGVDNGGEDWGKCEISFNSTVNNDWGDQPLTTFTSPDQPNWYFVVRANHDVNWVKCEAICMNIGH